MEGFGERIRFLDCCRSTADGGYVDLRARGVRFPGSAIDQISVQVSRTTFTGSVSQHLPLLFRNRWLCEISYRSRRVFPAPQHSSVPASLLYWCEASNRHIPLAYLYLFTRLDFAQILTEMVLEICDVGHFHGHIVGHERRTGQGGRTGAAIRSTMSQRRSSPALSAGGDSEMNIAGRNKVPTCGGRDKGR